MASCRIWRNVLPFAVGHLFFWDMAETITVKNFEATCINFEAFTRGDTFRHSFKLNEDGFDWTSGSGTKVRWKMKRTIDASAPVEKESPGDITLTFSTTTTANDTVEFNMEITPLESKDLIPGTYLYDIEITRPNTDVYTAYKGTIKVDGDVTTP